MPRSKNFVLPIFTTQTEQLSSHDLQDLALMRTINRVVHFLQSEKVTLMQARREERLLGMEISMISQEMPRTIRVLESIRFLHCGINTSDR
jgi:hypothetical protein